MLNDWATWCWRMRTNLRMTQAEAADVASTTVRTWRRWESYETTPPEHVKDRVRDAFTVEAAAYIGAIAGARVKEPRRERD